MPGVGLIAWVCLDNNDVNDVTRNRRSMLRDRAGDERADVGRNRRWRLAYCHPSRSSSYRRRRLARRMCWPRNTLKLLGALPKLNELSFAHCDPQYVTSVPTLAFSLPITNGSFSTTTHALIDVEPVAKVVSGRLDTEPGSSALNQAHRTRRRLRRMSIARPTAGTSPVHTRSPTSPLARSRSGSRRRVVSTSSDPERLERPRRTQRRRRRPWPGRERSRRRVVTRALTRERLERPWRTQRRRRRPARSRTIPPARCHTSSEPRTAGTSPRRTQRRRRRPWPGRERSRRRVVTRALTRERLERPRRTQRRRRRPWPGRERSRRRVVTRALTRERLERPRRTQRRRRRTRAGNKLPGGAAVHGAEPDALNVPGAHGVEANACGRPTDATNPSRPTVTAAASNGRIQRERPRIRPSDLVGSV